MSVGFNFKGLRLIAEVLEWVVLVVNWVDLTE